MPPRDSTPAIARLTAVAAGQLRRADQSVPQRRKRVRFSRSAGAVAEPADAPHPLRQLRFGDEQRSDDRPTNNGKERSPVHHSMISSICASNDGEIVNPSACAVFRLITAWSVVGCWTGRSAGLAPLMILST